MKSVKRLSRYTSILLSVLLMLSAMSPGITALAQEKANAAPTVLNYEDDNIKAELKAAEGDALPTGAALQVKALNKDSQDEAEKALYAETEAGLNAKAAGQGTAVNGFIAYSVQLQDKAGKNVTPEKGSFTLKITYKNPDAPEAYQKSQSTEKGVTLYQKTEGKDEQNNTIYTMEPTQEDSTQITADENGKVQSVESKLTTLEPVAVTWESVPQVEPATQNDGEQPAEDTTQNVTSEAVMQEVPQDAAAKGAVSNLMLNDNQYWYSFHYNDKENAWKKQDIYFNKWIVNIVDSSNNPINVKELLGNVNDRHRSLNGKDNPNGKGKVDWQVQQIAPELTGYQFLEARIQTKNNNESKIFRAMSTWVVNNKYQYDYKTNADSSGYFWSDEIKNDGSYDSTITFVYSKPLTETETVDSAQYGVNIQMFDYNTAIPNLSWGGYGNGTANVGRIKQGLVQRKLNEEGIPVSAVQQGNYTIGKALKDNFSVENNSNYKGEANHLFRLDEFEKDQTFYYSSFENYAYWNGADPQSQNKEFTVYDQIGTPKNDGNYFYKRGNFMPYNPIADGKFSTNHNLYDENGNELKEGDPRYNEPLYKTQWATSGATDGENGNNYQFGMVVSANFAQLENGKFKGNDMVYEFNGDDDMWVFVDGVLALDIGGIHDAHSGSINFATGEVQWYDCKKGGTPELFTTTLEQQFKVAGENTDEWQTSNTPDSEGKYNKIFSDYSNHDIKIFYMERGGGASNCKMKFNLPVIPKNSIKVAKTVDNINEGSYSDVEFKFKLYIESEEQNIPDSEKIEKNGKIYQLVKNKDYQRQEGSKIENVTIADDGVFKLHHGQEALFQDIATNDKLYIVEEIGVDQSRYDEFTVNSQLLDKDENIIKSETDGTCIVRTNPLSVGKSAYVNFVNHCQTENRHSIEIKKMMREGQKSDETFQAQIEIGGQLFNGKYSVKKEDGTPVIENATCENGIINLKADEIITIPDIAADTSFRVKEVNLDNNRFDNPQYTIQPDAYNNAIINENGVSGNVIYGHNAQVTVTNTLKLGSLKITKTITEDSNVDYMDGDPIFTFKITGPNNIESQEPQVFYRTLRLSKDVGKTASITIDNLPIGEYTVEELNTMRYTCISSNPQTGTVQQNNTEETKDTPPVEFTFTNKLTNEDYFSHTDVVENSFKIGEDGTVTVEKHKVPEGQVPDGTTPVQPSNE
ncbi:fibro-slime domain-containing cell surface protein [Eubacterium limosum]|nr:fibro-slime domain-containing cell surface protein [Eubacterium limosum]